MPLYPTPISLHLQSIKRLIHSPEQWCQGRMRTKDGRRCLRAAIYDAVPNYSAQRRIFALLYDLSKCSLHSYNDHHSHSEVINLLDQGIALSMAREALYR